MLFDSILKENPEKLTGEKPGRLWGKRGITGTCPALLCFLKGTASYPFTDLFEICNPFV